MGRSAYSSYIVEDISWLLMSPIEALPFARMSNAYWTLALCRHHEGGKASVVDKASAVPALIWGSDSHILYAGDLCVSLGECPSLASSLARG